MFEFKIIRNNEGEITAIETGLTGHALLDMPKLNKGCAFTHEEREEFGLTGFLPHQVETLDQQVARMYVQYHEHHTNLGKNIYLNVLHDYNETLFYKLASQHLEEMLPIVYTPTVGEAVQRFSLEHRKPRGLYISYPDRDKMESILDNRLPPEVDLTVVTDGEAVLGIGDQGIGGINISNAKLMVYTLCGGINPHRVLPIQLDVGTNNPHLLNDPMYLGWRHERISGQQFDDFIDMFVTAITKKFPDIFLHWEDMGRDNARRLLSRYRDKICTINGDMQGTGVVGLATVLAGVIASGMPLRNHRIVIMGAGTAGVGIADQVYGAMRRAGLSEEEARARFWLLDRPGLLTQNASLLPFQAPYARKEDVSDWELRDPHYIGLYDVVKNVRPTILIGCSTVAGAFSEEIVKMMASHVDRPIIMPLSNPTSLAEAKPDDLLKWTRGKAIIAAGSPFPDVMYDNKWYRIAQSNNALAFPGIGLGAVAVKAKHVTDEMLWAATQALSECSPVNQDKMAPILPKLSETKMVSFKVALAVAEQARKEGLAQIPEQANLKDVIKKASWEPRYYPYRKA
ncbi:NAD-dependent malic enzyme [Aquicella lusitana]|uniref:Malolactic enzyme n=1 Tax=Aquicella lusitana TaxID=254246 RepID=A0A370GEH1_9COXI|nr:NAD-dependent malic enzyme [Aquicella lusitana]RDI41499.1 NAD-dependent malic enzyme [Aquicella lusitana]VVC72607.1 putative NAD-dependent malic enzyme 2 [Aquicella lusitana]